jgi:hypothetical protein
LGQHEKPLGDRSVRSAILHLAQSHCANANIVMFADFAELNPTSSACDWDDFGLEEIEETFEADDQASELDMEEDGEVFDGKSLVAALCSPC